MSNTPHPPANAPFKVLTVYCIALNCINFDPACDHKPENRNRELKTGPALSSRFSEFP